MIIINIPQSKLTFFQNVVINYITILVITRKICNIKLYRERFWLFIEEDLNGD